MSLPRTFAHGDERVTIGRAWPRDVRLGRMRLRVEGRDLAGRLRAGEVTLQGAAEEWTVIEAQLLDHGRDPRLPGLPDAAGAGELLVHRSGRRAVVRCEGCYLKVVRPTAVDRLVAATRTGSVLAGRAGWRAPTATPQGAGTVRLSVVPGTSLHELAGHARSSRLTQAWTAFADGWPAIVARGDGISLPTHTAKDEAAVVDEWLGRALLVLSGRTIAPGRVDTSSAVIDGLRSAGEEVRGSLLAAPGRRLVPAHRDLHDKQLIAGVDGGLGILDLDTAALAEVELDLANLAEHVLLRGRQGLWPQDAVDHGIAAVMQTLERVGGDPDRFAAYRGATRLRLACLYLFRPSWTDLARRWLAELAGVDESALMIASSERHTSSPGSRA